MNRGSKPCEYLSRRAFQGREQIQTSWDKHLLGKTEERERGECVWLGQELGREVGS